MANHTLIRLGVRHEWYEAERLLVSAVKDSLGDPFEVRHENRASVKQLWPRAKCIWFVHLPETKPRGNPMQPDDYGFMVIFNNYSRQEWEFRHPINAWEYWAQSRVSHTLAKQYGLRLYNDGEDEYHDPNPEILAHPTYAEYLSRNYQKPVESRDRVFLQRLLDTWAPPGYRTLA